MTTQQYTLNGKWSYRVGYGEETEISVPFSRLPVGRSECTRTFHLPAQSDRVFLKFDGITYFARIYLNGTELGEMLPYCEYEFEITDIVRPLDNELRVVLEDLDRAFGPSEGWENFGGIIRDVTLLLRDEQYIQNVFFRSAVDAEKESALCSVEIAADCHADARFEIVLFDGKSTVLSYTQAAGEVLEVTASDLVLWSPDDPHLYMLIVTLFCGDEECDIYSAQIGFKSLTCDRHRFYLNGEPIFLKGVCKHEMVGDSGHCPTLRQIEHDMCLIKSMGCNFVRLVHYPHRKEILGIADRLGLLVSEEPGLWWSDTANEEVAEGSKEVLRRTILRDRNHVSVAFWLCFNECIFTERFLMESAAVCRANDPTRMVSGANCMSDEDTLLYYNKCGFDFYTMHPYAQTFDRARRSASLLCDKPLVFTEWGGYFLYNNPHLLADFMENMRQLYQEASDEGALAGAFFWFFAELNDFNRGEPACTNGVLHEGLVDQQRKPTTIFNAFCRGLALMELPVMERKRFWIHTSDDSDELPVSPLRVLEQSNVDLLSLMQADAAHSGNKRHRLIKRGPIPHDGTVLIASKNQPLVIEANEATDALTVLGLTSPRPAYPLGGTYGEELGSLTITYESGRVQTVSLQNGVHITTVFATNGSSRINPIAERAPRFAEFGYDKNFEIYVMNRLEIPTDSKDKILTVRLTASTEILIYGIFTNFKKKEVNL